MSGRGRIRQALRGSGRGGLSASAVAAAAAALACVPGVARAENPVITMQARAANADFLAFAPPPPAGAAAVCLVDSGVDLNPDTAANVVHREAIDGGDGGDVRDTKHGTAMAMTMGAPVNDWGGVGAWPHVRIASVRALGPGDEVFPFHVYEQALIRCDEAAGARRIAVVNLSLGGAGASAEAVARLRDRMRGAHRDGTAVVAAGGNRGGAVEYPAAIPEAFAVAGADATGALCAFSARGEGVDVVAPGCGLDVGLPDGRAGRASGTSDAAAFTSAVLAALRSYRPDLGPLEAEALLVETARRVDGNRVLNVEAAFRAAGLEHVVDAGRAAAPVGPPPHEPPRPHGDAAPGRGGERVPPRPRLRAVGVRRSVLTVRTAGRPPGARLRARVAYRSGGEFRRGLRVVERRASTIRVRLPRDWRSVELRYRGAAGWSPPLRITPRTLSNRRR